jgi:hypothetical protein
MPLNYVDMIDYNDNFLRDPIPVKLDPPSKMKDSIQRALNKTQVQISAKGNCKSIKVIWNHLIN